jgi:integration host factor subunit beta
MMPAWQAATDAKFSTVIIRTNGTGREARGADRASPDAGPGNAMNTITKKDLVDRIAEESGYKRVLVKRVVQRFLDEIIDELGVGNRLEFRDFGVFEIRDRAARVAQNPKTLERVQVPRKRTVKFKIGRLMKARLIDDGKVVHQIGADSAQNNGEPD